MNIIQRVTGSGVILLASIVLILCIAGIIGVSFVTNRANVLEDQVFDAAQKSLVFMDEKLTRIEDALKNSHRRVELLLPGVNELPEKNETKKSATSLLKTLDEEVFEPLKSAQAWLDSTHAVAVGVGTISEAVVSSKYAASHEDSLGVAMAGQLQDASESVIEILATLNDVRQGLIDIRDDVLSARRIALMIVARLAQVEKRMANLCERTERFHARVVEMNDEVAEARSRLHGWTMLGAVLVTVLMVWVAISQVSMVLHGWSWVKRQGIVEPCHKVPPVAPTVGL